MGTTVVIATHNEFLVDRFRHQNYISKVGAWTRPPALATDMAQRTDVPLSDDSTTPGPLDRWCDGVFSGVGTLSCSDIVECCTRMGDGLEGSLTVQVPGAETDAKIVAAVRVLLKTDGVDSARPIPPGIGKMLEPWLEASRQRQLAIATGHRRSAQAGCDNRFYHPCRASENAVPSASLETHEKWRNALLLLFNPSSRGNRRHTFDICRSARRDRLDDTKRFGRTS